MLAATAALTSFPSFFFVRYFSYFVN